MEHYEYLAHHGVKGMKWGVRRYQNPDGSLTDKGRKRYMTKYVTDYDDEGKEVYAYTFSKRGERAFSKFKKKNVGSYFTGVESRNYKDPSLLLSNKKGTPPTTTEMLASLIEHQSELFQDGRMFTNEYLAMNEAIRYGTIAKKFEVIKDEASWRYRTGRPTPGENWEFQDFDFGRKKFRHEK